MGALLPILLGQFFYKGKNLVLFENYIAGLITLTLVVFTYLLTNGSLIAFYLASSFLLLGSLKYYKESLSLIKSNSSIIIIWIAFSCFGVCSLASEKFLVSDFTAANIQNKFALPIDNLLQYQTIRYITEMINPVTTAPVPTWSFGDRGPLAGIIISFYFLLFALRETAPWLGSTGQTFLLFEVMMVLLNSMILLPFSSILNFNNTSHKKLGLLVLLTSPFIFINTFFTWPKLFSASLMLHVLYKIILDKDAKNRDFFFYGFLIALSLLAHEQSIFILPGLFVYLAWKFKLKKALTILLASITTYSPWLIFRAITGLGGMGTFVCNALCMSTSATENKSSFDLIKLYFQSHSIIEILKTRFYNLLYPIDLLHYDWLSFFSKPSLERFILGTASLNFYQLVFGLGVILFLRLLFIIPLNLKKSFKTSENQMLLTVMSSLPVAALLSGCELMTTNHIWAYSLIVYLMAYSSNKSKFVTLDYLCLGAQIVFNLLTLSLYLWGSPLAPVLSPYGLRAENYFSIREFYMLLFFIILGFSFFKIKFSTTPHIVPNP